MKKLLVSITNRIAESIDIGLPLWLIAPVIVGLCVLIGSFVAMLLWGAIVPRLFPGLVQNGYLPGSISILDIIGISLLIFLVRFVGPVIATLLFVPLWWHEDPLDRNVNEILEMTRKLASNSDQQRRDNISGKHEVVEAIQKVEEALRSLLDTDDESAIEPDP